MYVVLLISRSQPYKTFFGVFGNFGIKMRQKVQVIFSEKACWIFQADHGQKCTFVKNPGEWKGFQKAPAGSYKLGSSEREARIALSFVACLYGDKIWATYLAASSSLLFYL
jgi:hypothetical protein